MSDTTKVNNWSFPFKPKEGNLDSIQHLTAMAKAGGGYYPIGKNGQWHGGIHFDDKTAAVFDQKQVCCIADGEVIAYRVDRNYPTSAYVSSSQSSVSAPFSRCFVLVKHRLQAPDLPARQGVTPVPPPALSFFSLYMHLLDWDSYSKAEAPTAPAFMGETLYSVKPDKAVDSVHGLRVRAAPTNGAVTALLPKGTKVKVAPGAASSKWRMLLSIVEGRAIPALTGEESWVYIGEMQAVAGEPDTFLVAEGANDEEPSLAPQKGLNVRKTGNGKGSDPRTGLLPVGAKFSLKAGKTAYRELQQIIEGQEVLPLSTSSFHNIKGFVHFGSLDTTRSEPVLDAVHVLPKPYPIKAGELIGHLGQYQNYNGGSAKPLLHLEVFSCEDVPSFIAKSRAWAASLPDQQKTQLRVYKGASKLIPHREDINEGNPPKTSDPGTTVGVDLLIPQSLLDALPANHKLQVSTTLPGSTTPAVTRWWRLNNLLADNGGNPISGWLAEQEPITTRHSPWEWVGYDFIKETGRPIGKAVYLYDALRRLTDEERANYRTMVSQEDQGPVKARLYDIIDTNRDNKLTTSEIRSALAKPWHAQSIAQLITYYESEWLWKDDKWDELDPLMGHIPYLDPNQNWESEKARIEKLSWWESLAGKQGISADGKAWHFHPALLSEWFVKNCPPKCKVEAYKMDTTKGVFTVSKRVFDYILETESYREFPYALPDDKSGITIGYGYDLGQQTLETIGRELAGIYTPAEISILKTAQGKKGADARSHLSHVSHIAISQENAMKLAAVMKKRYAQQVVDVYPQAVNLHPDCQGALLSLVINRGNSFTRPSVESRKEMAEIREDLDSGNIHLIPGRIRSMKRLWTDSTNRGVAIRRDREADFFEGSVECTCWE